MKFKYIIVFNILIIISFLIIDSSLINETLKSKDYDKNYTEEKDNQVPYLSLEQPNAKPLLVKQYAQISNSFFPLALPTNISYTLVEGWDSKNTTIFYNGLTHNKDHVINSDFTTTEVPWVYHDRNTEFIDEGRDGDGYMKLKAPKDKVYTKSDTAFYEENITLQESLSEGKIARFSIDYYYDDKGASEENLSLYMAIVIGGVEANKTVKCWNLLVKTWTTLTFSYIPTSTGQSLPNQVSIRMGMTIHNDTTIDAGDQKIWFDNVEYEVWTEINQNNLLVAYDIEKDQTYSYQNITFGQGKTLINVNRYRNSTSDVVFTISKNASFTEEFEIFNITIISSVDRSINSSIGGNFGSLVTYGNNINWRTEFTINIPYSYLNNWAQIEKPTDWNLTSLLDGFSLEKVKNCIGTGIGSNITVIPVGVLSQGLWVLYATSQNYINGSQMQVWNISSFTSTSYLYFNDFFRFKIDINNTINLINTRLNIDIYRPNGTLFWNQTIEPSSYSIFVGNFSVGTNMTTGKHTVIMEWINNISQNEISQVGYSSFNFYVIHNTSLTAVDIYYERNVGDPLLIKVNFTDTDLNKFVEFATITFNTSISSGNMVYIGSGIYAVDFDTSPLTLGDYYFSFNASKIYYENHSLNNLIHLAIVAQPLALEVPSSAINTMGNSYAICRLNVTGALTGSLITDGANVSTDWNIGYTVSEHYNGTYTMNFSTNSIPTQGILQSFTINIFANKTDYGSTSNFITLIVHPIPTVISINKSIHNVYLNEIFYVKINYTIEASGSFISGASYTITWSSNYDVIPVADGYIIRFDTIGLSVDGHTALIKMEHVGYETEYTSVSVIVGRQRVNLTLLIDSQQVQENYLVETFFNDIISLSSRAYAEAEHTYLSNCTITFINDNYEKNLTKSVNYWHNTSIEISTSDFRLGINYVYIRFTRTNYTTGTFSFQILVKQINIEVDIIDFKDSVEAFAGEIIKIEIKLTEEFSGKPVEGADISYEWEFGIGEFEEKADGVYEVRLEIPENIEGNYDLELIISKSGSVYKSSEEDLTITVKERELPEYWFWIIIAALSIGMGLLAAISLRAYVFLPRARRKESELLAKTQNFKDMRSIQAVVLIHRNSGLPLYYKTYNFLQHADAHLFSGFVQAITTIGREIVESDKGAKLTEKQRKYAEHMMEIDFKYFYALIFDHEDLRIVLILNERSSDSLREKLKDLSLVIIEELGDSIKEFDGLLEPFEQALPSILSKSIDLHYKEFFKISNDEALFLKTKKEREISSMETRLFNVLTSYSKGGNNFVLESIFKMISEKSEDLIIEAIESLIQRKLIIPTEGNSGLKFSKGSSYK